MQEIIISISTVCQELSVHLEYYSEPVPELIHAQKSQQNPSMIIFGPVHDKTNINDLCDQPRPGLPLIFKSWKF